MPNEDRDTPGEPQLLAEEETGKMQLQATDGWPPLEVAVRKGWAQSLRGTGP